MQKQGMAKGKAKESKNRTPRNDEMSIASKVINKNAKENKPRPRHPSAKRSIAARPIPTQTVTDQEHTADESNSHENSQTALHGDSFRLKGKKARSRDCEEAISTALSDFWDSAWNICAERFFITSAPVTVSFELRNAWLRIAEAEWQDLDMRETPNTRPNRIFKRDEPPLPLAFDSWSIGAMELLPRFRHESVMDPFLRDLGETTHVDQPEMMHSSEEMDEEEEEDEDEESHNEGKDDEDGAAGAIVEMLLSAPEGAPDPNNWQFELDDEHKLMKAGTTPTSTPPKSESPPKLSEESQQEAAVEGQEEQPIMILLSPRSLSVEESTTDIENSSASRAISAYSRKSQIKRKFSPSQCGGRVGSGVFRFPTETTSEAVRRMRENIRDHHIQSHVQIIDEDRVAYKTKRSVQVDDDMVVQPLFEEQTPRSAGHDNANRFHELSWRGVSYNQGQPSIAGSMDNGGTDMDKKFLQRKLINLRSRFKKQSIKYFGHPTKTVEETAETSSLQDSRRSSTGSSFKSKTSKKPGGLEKRKVTRGVSMKYPSNIGFGGNVVSTQSRTKNMGTKAKAAASDPGLKRNKEPLFSSLLERRLKTGIFEPPINVQKSGGFQFSHGSRGAAVGTSRMELLDPELRNKRSRNCKTCQTATNTSSS